MQNYFEELGIPNQEKEFIINKTINLFRTKDDLLLEPKVVITEEDSTRLNLTLETKKVLAERIRDYVELNYPSALVFDYFDEEFNIVFKPTEYEAARRKGMEFLVQNPEYFSYYIEEYKLLLVAEGSGSLIGQVSEIEPYYIDDAVFMVNSLYNQYGHIRGEFRQIKDLYLKDNDLPYN